ncbi:MAG TPA: hypothetical protein RMH99_19650 [Sandaracinaceae bacterium LLY-WYZ-13_1]|nr:hypothetical protein [Sandaracinaceae bacterium LLY-WYZ-13_1]
MRVLRPSLALAASLLSGCTAVVSGVEPPECMTNDQCAVLNELEGIPADACELYQCSSDTRRCVLQIRDADRDGLIAAECSDLDPSLPVDCNDAFAGGMEVCNGFDDDCDGVIDERFVADDVATNPLPAEPPETLVAVGGVDALGSVGYGPGAGAVALAHADDGTASFGLVGGAMSADTELGFARASSLTSLSDTELTEGCHTPRTDGTIGNGSCVFDDLDLGLTEESVFTAVVSTGGCSDGQLRVGYVERGDASAGRVIERGPRRRSNAFAGVDVDPTMTGDLPCTGASRASGARGAARPSVGAMNRSGPEDQALVAWLATPIGRDACGGDPVDVEILATLREEETFGDTIGWVTGSNDGVPQVVGATPGGGRPGIGVWEGTGYLVAFAAEGGGIALSFVDQAARPPAYDRDGAPDEARPTDTLSITDLGTIPTDGSPDDVSVSFGSIRPGGIDVALAWREGCGSGSETVWFRQLFLTRDGGTVRLDEDQSFDAVPLTAEATPAAGPPTLAYTFAGMLAPGVERADGRPTASDMDDGGWIVAWEDASMQDMGPADDRRILARRLSEIDGGLVSPDELLVLHPPGDRRRVRPQLYVTEDDQVRYVFFELGEPASFRGGALTCLPEAEG